MELSGFFPSNGDRKYKTKEIANFLSNLFTNGIFNNSCAVVANNNMTVTIKSGYAFINGYWYHNNSDKILNVNIADSLLSRIDNVVLRFNMSNREITAEIVEGEPSDDPVAPELLRNEDFFDLRIAKITLAQGTDKVIQSIIEDCRFDSSDCGNVTQAVLELDTSEIFKQYNSAFLEWFENIKNILSEDAAGNLTNEVNNLKDKNLEFLDIEENEVNNYNYFEKYLVNQKDNKIFNGIIPRYEELKNKILWINPLPQNSIAEKTIELENDDYDYLEIYYYDWNNNGFKNLSSIRILKGYSGTFSTIFNNNGHLYFGERTLKRVNDTKYTLSQNYGLWFNGPNYAIENINSVCVPIMIYGGKF